MIDVRICETVYALGIQAAELGAEAIREALRTQAAARIILATGASQFATLAQLVAAPGIDWARVTIFHLDEYVGLGADHPASFRRYLRERVLQKLGEAPNFVAVAGDTPDVQAEADRLGRLIAGEPVDVCFAGIGENCHLAFNDPPADFETEAPFIVVELDDACRRQQLGEGWFASLDEVPTRAISMSISQMLRSRLIVLSVPDLRKADAARAAVEGPISPQYPASASALGFPAAKPAGVKSAGLVDLQVNGFAGVDFNAGVFGDGDIETAMLALRATGVTCLLPTIITATQDDLRARFAALDDAISRCPMASAMCPGYHLEGPFLNPADGYAGCHPPGCMTTPDYALVEALERGLTRPILLITIASELPGAEAFIRQARAAGKLVAIGHSATDFDTAERAADAGATLATHLGNGLPQILPKLANPIMAQLAEDRLFACFIADGLHIPPPALKVLIRAAGARAVLVSDAVAAAAGPEGTYPFAGMRVHRDALGTVSIPGQAGLAGSSLCLDAAIRNLVAWGIAVPEQAVAMASTRPARLLAAALQSHGLLVPPGSLEWSEQLFPTLLADDADVRVLHGRGETSLQGAAGSLQMTRIALLGFSIECNRFAPVATEHDFAVRTLFRGEALLAESRAEAPRMLAELPGFVADMDAAGPWTPVPLVLAMTAPSGPVEHGFFERLMAEWEAGLVAAGALDGVYCVMHGAGLTTQDDDPEGTILTMVRRVVGAGVKIVASYDLHGNISENDVTTLDAFVAYRTNPHLDMRRCGAESAQVMRRLLAGTPSFLARVRLPIVPPTVTMLTGQDAPNRPYGELIDLGQQRMTEAPYAGRILNVSMMGGFAFADTPYNGLTAVVTATDAQAAQSLAQELAEAGWARRAKFYPSLTSLEDATRLAVATRDAVQPALAFADVADNPGGGGGGNTMFILEAFLAAGVRDALVGVIHDPALAAEAHALGVGATFNAHFNRQPLSDFARPLHAKATVRSLRPGPIHCRRGIFAGGIVDLGASAALDLGGIVVVVISQREQCADPAFFEAFGLDIAAARVVAVKSRGHFRGGFDEFFGHDQVIEVDAPGLTSPIICRVR
eukprot:gene2140-2177_t